MAVKHKLIFGLTLFLIFSLAMPVNAEVEAPKKQLKKGILAENITCKEGLNLIIRNNGAPACVKPATAERFQNLGLASIPVKFTDLPKESPYLKNQQFNLEMHKMKLRAFLHLEERLQISTLQMMI
jgi:hypothetical protein